MKFFFHGLEIFISKDKIFIPPYRQFEKMHSEKIVK